MPPDQTQTVIFLQALAAILRNGIESRAAGATTVRPKDARRVAPLAAYFSARYKAEFLYRFSGVIVEAVPGVERGISGYTRQIFVEDRPELARIPDTGRVVIV